MHSNGLKYTYEVKSVYEVSPQTLWIINHQLSAWITLITCQDYAASSDTYLRRTVVKAVLVGVTSE